MSKEILANFVEACNSGEAKWPTWESFDGRYRLSYRKKPPEVEGEGQPIHRFCVEITYPNEKWHIAHIITDYEAMAVFVEFYKDFDSDAVLIKYDDVEVDGDGKPLVSLSEEQLDEIFTNANFLGDI